VTVAIAVRHEDGVTVVTDSAINFGDNRVHMPGIKGKEYGSLWTLFAGDLWAVSRALVEPAPKTVQEFSTRLIALSGVYHEDNKHPDFPAEFLVIDPNLEISILSGEGDLVSGFDYACIGSGGATAWPLLDALLAPKRMRRRSRHAVRTVLGEVMRLTEKYCTSVYRPYHYEEV